MNRAEFLEVIQYGKRWPKFAGARLRYLSWAIRGEELRDLLKDAVAGLIERWGSPDSQKSEEEGWKLWELALNGELKKRDNAYHARRGAPCAHTREALTRREKELVESLKTASSDDAAAAERELQEIARTLHGTLGDEIAIEDGDVEVSAPASTDPAAAVDDQMYEELLKRVSEVLKLKETDSESYEAAVKRFKMECHALGPDEMELIASKMRGSDDGLASIAAAIRSPSCDSDDACATEAPIDRKIEYYLHPPVRRRDDTPWRYFDGVKKPTGVPRYVVRAADLVAASHSIDARKAAIAQGITCGSRAPIDKLRVQAALQALDEPTPPTAIPAPTVPESAPALAEVKEQPAPCAARPTRQHAAHLQPPRMFIPMAAQAAA